MISNNVISTSLCAAASNYYEILTDVGRSKDQKLHLSVFDIHSDINILKIGSIRVLIVLLCIRISQKLDLLGNQVVSCTIVRRA